MSIFVGVRVSDGYYVTVERTPLGVSLRLGNDASTTKTHTWTQVTISQDDWLTLVSSVAEETDTDEPVDEPVE